MSPITVLAGTALHVTYSLHEAENPVSEHVAVFHHGICHTREQFLPLIARLNEQGIHAAVIDQQSEKAGFFRNFIGASQYREGMAAAVRIIQEKMPIGCYILHSMGALIGQEMQEAYPKLQRPTILMAPIPVNGALPITLRLLRKHPLSYLKAVLTLDIHSLAKTPKQVREVFFDRFTPEPIVEETAAQLKHAPFWMYCQLVLRPLVRPRIQNDGLPKLLLFSETDEIFHPREYKRTRGRYSQLEEDRIKGGHDFFIESAETTAERIGKFVQLPRAKAIPRPHIGYQPDGVKSTEGNQGADAPRTPASPQ